MRDSAYCDSLLTAASSSSRVTLTSSGKERHMSPSRRQFVASIAAVPFLPHAAAALERQGGAADQVLQQILADLRDLSIEFEAQPGSRKATMRAMESALGIGAAHLSAAYDAGFKGTLQRARARRGLAALTQDIVMLAQQRDANVTFDAVETAMTRLEQRGLSGCFRDVQQSIRKVRLQAPDQIQAAASRTVQFDYCADLIWMIQIMEATVAIACGIAILEPTVGGEIACGAMTLALGLLLLQRSFFC
jgi:hypothetical protein